MELSGNLGESMIGQIGIIVAALIGAYGAIRSAQIMSAGQQGAGGGAATPGARRVVLWSIIAFIGAVILGAGIGFAVAGLRGYATVLPSAALAFYDFENGDHTNWSMADNTPGATLDTADQAALGSGALRVSAEANPGAEFDYHILLKQPRVFKADTIVARVYWPERPGVEVQYASLCVRPVGRSYLCEALPQKPGTWHTFTLNMNRFIEQEDGQPPLVSDYSNLDLEGLAILGKYRPLNPSDTPDIVFFVDAVEIWSEQ